ncbi:unnamed protein product [Blepharisma stoltei]|uniref:CHCH domain-containing protein n=1 Tax=Blepharisma stoltei TaxID=1481888 RepID=A0AAU9JUR8_9CILI|nr:unnamed protein product [Blepharisma stoltei]
MEYAYSASKIILPVLVTGIYYTHWRASKEAENDKQIKKHCQKQDADLYMCMISNGNKKLCKDAQSELDYCVYQHRGY